MSPKPASDNSRPGESRRKKIANRLLLALLSLCLMAAVIGLHSIFFVLDVPGEARLPFLILLLLAIPALGFAAYVKLHKASLRAKIIAAFLVASLAPMAILTYLDQQVTFEALTQNTNQALLGAAKQTGARIDAFIQANLDSVRTESLLPEFRSYLGLKPGLRRGSREELWIMDVLRSLERRDGAHITSYALLDKDGMDVADTCAPDVGLDKAQRDYFEVPMRTGLPYVSAVSIAGVSNSPSLYFSSPVRDDNGVVIGVLRIRYAASVLQDILAQETGETGVDSFAVLVDENHVRLADGGRPELALSPVFPLSVSQSDQLRRERRISAEIGPTRLPDFNKGLAEAHSKPLFVASLHDAKQKPTQNAVVSLKNQPWYLVFAQSREQYLRGLTEQAGNAALLVGVIAVCVIIAALVMAKRISEPIVRLNEAAGKVTEGDHNVSVRVETGDELEMLAGSFNRMTGQLRELFKSLRRSHEELENKVEERTLELKKANEQLLEVNRLKSLFLSSASHELRTPLTSILGFAKLCSKTFTRNFLPSAKEQGLERKADLILENLGIIEKEGGRLTRLVNDLLDLNKIESGKTQWRDEELDMSALLERNLRAIRGQFSENPEVELTSHIASDLPVVTADPDRIDQVVLNLLSNAAKFTTKGSVRLSARSLGPDWPEWVEVRVEDTGPGISREDLDNIFEKFFQTGYEDHDRSKPEGTGLGLTICRQIIEHYQGRIWAESIHGEGSAFIFQLPGKAQA
jgi:signal transduction histidine kinase